MSFNEESPEFITALARGLQVIQAFSSEQAEMTLSEVAASTGLSPGTARRCLLTLQSLGFVGSVGRRFVLRPKILSLGSAFLTSMDIKGVAQPYLQDLVDEFHDSASLAVLDDFDVIYVALAASAKKKGFRAAVGYRTPAYATSVGHVLLANLPAAQLKAYLAKGPFLKYTPKTFGDPIALAGALEEVRRQGFARIEDQFEYGVLAVAVPVTDAQGHVIAAVNCSSEDALVDMETLVRTRVPRLRETAHLISSALERRPTLIHSILSSVVHK